MKRNHFSCFGVALLVAGFWLLTGTPTALAQTQGGMPPPGGQSGGANPNMPAEGMQPPGGLQNGQQTQMEQNILGNVRRNIEVENDLSKLAAKHSSDAEVKKFAQKVISDNRTLGEEVIQPPGQSGGMTLAPEVPSQTQKAEKQMKKLSGLQFDKMYLVQMDAYVKNDQQVGAQAAGLTGSSDVNQVGMRVQTLADERAKEISQLTAKENFKIQ